MRLTKKSVFTAFLLLFLSAGIFAQSSLKKGDKQYELKAYEAAIKQYEKYLKRKPNNALALSRIADSYRHLNQMTEAEKYYARAVEQSKTPKSAFLNYGKVLKALGQYDKAKTMFAEYAQHNKTVGQHYMKSCDFAKKNRNNPTSVEINNEFINTSGDDYAAVPFNNKVAFVSTRQDFKRKGGKKPKKDFAGGHANQLFITERDGSQFMRTPAFLHSDIKNQYNQGPIAYSPDGRWVAYTANNFSEGARQLPSGGLELGIYIAAVEGDADFSEAAAFPFNGRGFSTGYPAWGADGNTLYFASDRPDGFGGFDIYMSKRTGVSWSPPQNLGSIVNSKGNELSPFHDGTSLYFSSDWHDGLGGFDIFRAEKSGKRYTNIYHTGTGINSTYDDLYYTYDTANDVGYITSDRVGSKGGYDIYRIKRITRKMVVSVTDPNGRPIRGATIDFTSCGEGVFLTDANGLYSFRVEPGLDCKPMVRKTGFKTTSFTLSAKAPTDSRKIVLRPSSVRDDNGGGVVIDDTGGISNDGSDNSGTGTYDPNRSPQTDFLGFNGRIVNERNSVGLPNVVIRAQRNSDGMIMEATSDGSGNYIIGLTPNTSYNISFSKPGFLSANRSIRTGSTNDSSILGTTKIKSTSDGYVGNDDGGSNSGGNTGGVYTGGDTNGGNSGGTTTGGGTYTPPNTGGGIVPSTGGGYAGGSSGYAVQVAAVTARADTDLSSFGNLSDLGTVYYTPVGNIYKIRVGLYATAEEARSVAKLINTRGYNGAFMVTEGNVSIGTTSAPAQPSTGGGVTDYTPQTGRYVVRLAAYSNPQKYFQRDKVLDIGQIAEQYKGQFTIMLLTGYSTLDQAQRALAKAKARGFSEAYIAEDINGELRKVK